MPNAPTAARPGEQRVRHWNDFLAWVDVHSDSSWVFRGLGDPGFALLAGAGRIGTFSGANEKVILEIFERRAAEFMNLSGLSEWDKLAIAQYPASIGLGAVRRCPTVSTRISSRR